MNVKLLVIRPNLAQFHVVEFFSSIPRWGDQMARLFVKQLDIFNNENLPNMKKLCHRRFKVLPNTT